METHLESDLSLAAFLLVRKFRLIDLEQMDRGRYAFRFADDRQTADAVVAEYYNGGQVEAKQFSDSLRALKNRLYFQKSRANANGTAHANQTT